MTKPLIITEGLLFIVIGLLVNATVKSTPAHIIIIAIMLIGLGLIASTLRRPKKPTK